MLKIKTNELMLYLHIHTIKLPINRKDIAISCQLYFSHGFPESCLPLEMFAKDPFLGCIVVWISVYAFTIVRLHC